MMCIPCCAASTFSDSTIAHVSNYGISLMSHATAVSSVEAHLHAYDIPGISGLVVIEWRYDTSWASNHPWGRRSYRDGTGQVRWPLPCSIPRNRLKWRAETCNLLHGFCAPLPHSRSFCWSCVFLDRVFHELEVSWDMRASHGEKSCQKYYTHYRNIEIVKIESLAQKFHVISLH